MGAFLEPASTVDLHWAQLVDTNAPCLPTLPRPYVDPQCMIDTDGDDVRDAPDDTLPFYWTAAEHLSATEGNYQETVNVAEETVRIQMRFTDAPRRPLGQGTVDWHGILVVALRDSTEDAARFLDVIDWGFDLTCGKALPPPGGKDLAGGAGGDKPPAETEGADPTPQCERTSVKRGVTLRMTDEAAKGRVKPKKGLTQCSSRVPVQLLARSGSWRVVDAGRTKANGRFALDPEGPGDYRVRAKKVIRGAVDDIICRKAFSATRAIG